MCEFVSWIEYESEVYFLQYSDLTTKEGRELVKHLGDKFDEDVIGHGAIDRYYSLKGKGQHKECTDFSTPDNFPQLVVEAIKKGTIVCRGKVPIQILTAQAWAEYKKVRDQAWAEYNKVLDQAWAEYKKVRDQAFWGLAKKKQNRTDAWK